MIEAEVVTVEGLVQRVGFRRFVESVARDSKVVGYVENVRDGRVRVFAQGRPADMIRFMESIKKAPRPIEIDRIVKRKARAVPSLRYFQIKAGPLSQEIQEGFGAMERQFRDYRDDFKDYRGEFKSFRSDFGDYREEFRGFAQRTDENFKSLDSKYGEISTKLTSILEALQRQSETFQKELADTRDGLRKSVDNLSRLVDAYIQKSGS